MKIPSIFRRTPWSRLQYVFQYKDEFIFRDKGSFAGGMIDEKTVKMCAEKLNWGVGTVLTTARQAGWQGETYISCPKEKLPPGWLNPLTE